jgi:DNA-binding GntR family transcriptional regulator
VPTSDIVYARVRAAILSGEFEPEQALTEMAIAAWCDVSRTPVREALQRLEQDGLAERGDRGLRVATRSAEQILEVYEARIVLEGAVAEAAANRRTDVDIARLRRALDGSPSETDDLAALVATNRTFHRAVWTAGHNRTLIDLLERVEAHLQRYPFTTLSHPGRWAEATTEHRDLVSAIEDRRPADAADIARAHMRRARELRLQMWMDEAPQDQPPAV